MILTGLSGFRTDGEEETNNRNENILYVQTLLLLYAYQCIFKVFNRFCIPSLSTYFLTYFFAPLVVELVLLDISTTFYVKTKWLKSQEIESKLFILGKQSQKEISFCLVKVWRGGRVMSEFKNVKATFLSVQVWTFYPIPIFFRIFSAWVLTFSRESGGRLLTKVKTFSGTLFPLNWNMGEDDQHQNILRNFSLS